MRNYNESIEVQMGCVGDDEGPERFLWRNRLWRVLGVQSRWIESGEWWNGPAVRAARGDEALAESSDLLCEQELWRVEAANGLAGSRGIYELAHVWSDGSWQLRSVVD